MDPVTEQNFEKMYREGQWQGLIYEALKMDEWVGYLNRLYERDAAFAEVLVAEFHHMFDIVFSNAELEKEVKQSLKKSSVGWVLDVLKLGRESGFVTIEEAAALSGLEPEVFEATVKACPWLYPGLVKMDAVQ